MNFIDFTLNSLTTNGRGIYGISAPAVDYSSKLPTYLRITDINDDGTINKNDLKSVDDDNSFKYKLEENDIVFARTGGSTGRNYFYDKRDGDFVFAGFLIKFNIDPTKVNPKYIKYYCQSQKYKDWVRSYNTGSTRGNINAQTYGEMIISVPPRPQQDGIVKLLSCIDEKIAYNNRINDNLYFQMISYYKELFCNDNKRKRCRADEYFDITIGKTPPRKEQQWFSENPKDIKWFSIADMGKSGVFISASSEYLTEEAIEKYNVVIVPENTLILSFKLTVGRVAITTQKCTTNEAIAHFKTQNKDINPYLYCYLKTFKYSELGSTSSIATAINSKIVKAMPFIVPNDDELLKFNMLAVPVFSKIKCNEYENQRLSELRDTLLPKLMSGEIDVSDIKLDL